MALGARAVHVVNLDGALAYGAGTAYSGVYSLATLSANKLTITSYGLTTTGSKIADDMVIDTVALTH